LKLKVGVKVLGSNITTDPLFKPAAKNLASGDIPKATPP